MNPTRRGITPDDISYWVGCGFWGVYCGTNRLILLFPVGLAVLWLLYTAAARRSNPS